MSRKCGPATRFASKLDRQERRLPAHLYLARVQTRRTMGAMDNVHSSATDMMGQNNQLIRDQLARADNYVDRTRQAQAREAATQALPGTDGPVKL